MELKYHKRTYDLIGQLPLLENDFQIERKLKQFEQENNLVIPASLREFYQIKNRKTTLYQFLNIYTDVSRLGELFHSCFDNKILATDSNLYFENEYREKRLIHLLRDGDYNVYVHCQNLDDPILYKGLYSVYNGNFLWIELEHRLSDYIFHKVWDLIVLGTTAPKKYKTGWRFEMRGKAFSKDFYNLFKSKFTELKPTLTESDNRKFYRFEKNNRQFCLVYDDIETTYVHFYSADKDSLIELLNFIKQSNLFENEIISFRKGNRNRYRSSNLNEISKNTLELVKGILPEFNWRG